MSALAENITEETSLEEEFTTLHLTWVTDIRDKMAFDENVSAELYHFFTKIYLLSLGGGFFGFTDYQIEKMFGLSKNTIRGYLSELRKLGYLTNLTKIYDHKGSGRRILNAINHKKYTTKEEPDLKEETCEFFKKVENKPPPTLLVPKRKSIPYLIDKSSKKKHRIPKILGTRTDTQKTGYPTIVNLTKEKLTKEKVSQFSSEMEEIKTQLKKVNGLSEKGLEMCLAGFLELRHQGQTAKFAREGVTWAANQKNVMSFRSVAALVNSRAAKGLNFDVKAESIVCKKTEQNIAYKITTLGIQLRNNKPSEVAVIDVTSNGILIKLKKTPYLPFPVSARNVNWLSDLMEFCEKHNLHVWKEILTAHVNKEMLEAGFKPLESTNTKSPNKPHGSTNIEQIKGFYARV